MSSRRRNREQGGSASRLAAAFVLCSSVGLGCATHQASEATVVPGLVPADPPRSVPTLAPLSSEEALLQRELDAELAGFLSLGTRAFDEDGLALAGATDHVAARLESFGYEVKRRGFTHGESVAQNLEVEVPGLRRGNELVVLSAKLDANPGSPGADDNASGVAALLVLARRFHGQRALRSVRFVFLSSAGPRSTPEAQGSVHYARALKQELDESAPAEEPTSAEAAVTVAGPREVLVTLDLDGLGVFVDEPGSQRHPEAIIASHDRADFIALVSRPQDTEIAARIGDRFQESASLPSMHWVILPDDPWLADSVLRAFGDQGFPALQLTDTREFRFDQHGKEGDELARLDRSRLARVVFALESTVQTLLGPRGEVPVPNPEGFGPSAPAP